MHPLFENTVEMTLPRFLSLCDTPVGASALRDLRRWKVRGDVLIALSAALVAASALLRDWALVAATALLTAFCCYHRFWRRTRLNKRQYARIRQAQTTPEWLRTTRFGEDAVTVDDANAQTHFAYTDFCRVSEDAQTFYLWRDADFVLRLPKNSFTVGDAATFPAFIQQKLGSSGPLQIGKEANIK